MAGKTRRFTNDAAVRIFLGAQGFTDPRPTGRVDARHFSKLISRLRLVADRLCERGGESSLYSGVCPTRQYDRAALDRWIYDGRNMFEYWNHEQSFAPMSFHSMMRPRMDGKREYSWKAYLELQANEPDYIDSVLAEIRERGPITHRQLSDPGEKTGPWWGYGKGKIALGWLFLTGQITVARRVNFERHYDIRSV